MKNAPAPVLFTHRRDIDGADLQARGCYVLETVITGLRPPCKDISAFTPAEYTPARSKAGNERVLHYYVFPFYGHAAMPEPRKSTFEEGYIAIVDALIARRRELGWTQTDLGEAYGEDQSFISRIERRQRRIDAWEFVRFCRVLNLEPGDVLKSAEAAA